ncbi:hypothetical protein Tco_0836134 [Tanacetum coccineum]
MPKFYKTKADANKKSKTSGTTSCNTSDSIHGCFNLNDEVDDSDEEEVREVRPIDKDKAKKKALSSSIPSESSATAPAPFVGISVDK